MENKIRLAIRQCRKKIMLHVAAFLAMGFAITLLTIHLNVSLMPLVWLVMAILFTVSTVFTVVEDVLLILFAKEEAEKTA